MFSSDFIKNFAVFALVLLIFSSCRTAPQNGGESPVQTPPIVESNSRIPFSNKEPDSFQAEVFTVGDTLNERKTFVARSGEKKRYDFDFGTKRQLTWLQNEKNYLLLPENKIYAEKTSAVMLNADVSEFLIGVPPGAVEANFERIGTEDNTVIYRISPSAGAAEILIYVDETKGLPVRQEFYSVEGEQKKMTFRMEIRDLKIPADENLFVVPSDYRRVSEAELRKAQRDLQP